ncbi:MAG: hypothetical protein WA623_10935 [Candidatus Sulfotelmatobacter sp.]
MILSQSPGAAKFAVGRVDGAVGQTILRCVRDDRAMKDDEAARWELRLRRARYMGALVCVLVAATDAAAPGMSWGGQTGSVPTEAGNTVPGKIVQEKTGQDQAAREKASPEEDDGLVIEPGELPTTYPQGRYLVRLHARGDYVPTLHWRLEKGALPPGIKLAEDGALSGEAQRAGEFRFVVAVRDGGKPQQAVQKGFVIKVIEGLTVEWKVPAHVTANRIDGSVEVSNMTADDMDLTFDVKAVAENGRATEIGYQHFPLKQGTIGMMLPFGETLPHGNYVVYVDVNGEIAQRNKIYKRQMQTPKALQVVVGP